MEEQRMERINSVTKLPPALTLLAVCFLALSGCPEGAGRGGTWQRRRYLSERNG